MLIAPQTRFGDHMDYKRHRPSFFSIKREPRHAIDEDNEDEEEEEKYDDNLKDLDEIWDESQGRWPTDAV
jgi:hypothetical protein